MDSRQDGQASFRGRGAPRIGMLMGALLLTPVLMSCDNSTAPLSPPGELELSVDRAEYRMGDSITVTAQNVGPGLLSPRAEMLVNPCLGILERETAGAGWETAPLSDRSCAIALGERVEGFAPGEIVEGFAPGEMVQAAFVIGSTGAEGSYWAFEPGTTYRWSVPYGVHIDQEFEMRTAHSPAFTVVH